MKHIFVVMLTLFSLNTFAQAQTALPFKCTAILSDSGSSRAQEMELSSKYSDEIYSKLTAEIDNIRFSLFIALDPLLADQQLDMLSIDEFSEQGHLLTGVNVRRMKINTKTSVDLSFSKNKYARVDCRSAE